MDMQKCTQKSLEAIKAAQNLAIEYSNLQIETPHLACVLIAQPEGLIPQLLSKMNIDADALLQSLKTVVEKLPKVTGPGRERTKSTSLRKWTRSLPPLKSWRSRCRTSTFRWSTSSSRFWITPPVS